MFPLRGHSLLTAVLLGWVAARYAEAQLPPAEHVRNFAKVSDFVYRGGEPSSVGIEELGAMGIKIVIDLREPSHTTELERQQVEKLGMKYVNVPMKELSAPTTVEVNRVLAFLLRSDSGPVFVHCHRGKDRTGTVIACYRIQHDGWTNERAQSEASEYGMSRLERGMRSFIARFKPELLGQIASSGALAAGNP